MRLSPSDHQLPPGKSEPLPPPPSLPREPLEDSSDSFLAGYRERIMYLLAYMVTLFVSPFAVIHIYNGHYLLGLVIASVVVAFAVDGVAIHFKRRPPIPFAFVLVPAVANIILSLQSQGIYGALWCFPAVLLCYFVLNRTMAIAGSAALLALSSPMVYESLGLGVALRFAVSLAITVVALTIITDVIRALQRELTEQAVTDPLTGAFNRRQMAVSLGEAIERSHRTGAPAAVLLLDIDHFKLINDQLGHATGDRVLKDLVKLIGNRTRKLDKLFRMGGEEFLLLLPDTPAASAMIQAESLRLRVAESGILKDRALTISIGVSEYKPGQTREEWTKDADTALYRAKEGGRNRVVSEVNKTV